MLCPKSIIASVTIWGTCACAQAVDLSSAASYAVLGSTTVTSTGPTVLNGSLAVSPGTASTGFPPGVVTGVTSSNDAAASAVHANAMSAYNMAIALPCGTDLSNDDLGGKTLTPGVYCFSSSVGITGALTLDAQGDSNDEFVFQIGSTLITATAAHVVLINGARPCGVTWAVGSSATLGTSTNFNGNIITLISITSNSEVVSSGGLYALTGAVTLIGDQISAVGSCGTLSPPAHPPVTTDPPSPLPTSTCQIITSTITIVTSAATVTVTTVPTGMITTTTPSCKASSTVTITLSPSAASKPQNCKVTTVTNTWTTTKTATTTITRNKADTVTVTKPTTIRTTETSTATTTVTKTLHNRR